MIWWLIARLLVRPAFPVEFRGALMRPEAMLGHDPKAIVKRAVIRLAIRYADAKMYAVQGPLATGPTRYARMDIAAIPDPLLQPWSAFAAKEQARGRRALPKEKTLTVVLGRLSKRKNLPLIVACFRSGLLPRSHVLVIAGQPDATMADWVRERRAESQRRSDPVLWRPELLTDEELQDYLSAADVLVLLYENSSGSSGILSLAVQSEVPVVVYGNQYCEQAVRRFDLGRVLDKLDEDSLAAAITSLVSPEPPSERQVLLRRQARELLASSRQLFSDELLRDISANEPPGHAKSSRT